MKSRLMNTGATLPLIGIGCLLAFHLIGSTVERDGLLREPFPLLPIGWLLIIVGGAMALLALLRASAR